MSDTATTPDLYEHIIVTRNAVDNWRRRNNRPHEPIGLFFGILTMLHFLDDLDPTDFEMFPMPLMDDGYLKFEVAAIARWKYQSIYPRAVEVFSELR